MKIKRKLTTVEEIETDVQLPYYTKDGAKYCMFTEEKRGMTVWLFDNMRETSIQDYLFGSDRNATPITAQEFFAALETAKERLNKKEFLCKAAAIDADHSGTIMILSGPITIDTERQQEYQPKSKLYKGMINGISQGEKLEG